VRSAAAELCASLGGRRLIIGVDRLDYSKGIAHRLRAFDHFLDAAPDGRGGVTYLQVTPKSRIGVPGYGEMERELGTLVGRTNGRHGTESWTPIRYVNRSYSRSALAAFYRTARVTPLRDGMNLVATEYVAAQDPEDPGVPVVSRFAGAAFHDCAAFGHALANGFLYTILSKAGRIVRPFGVIREQD
jgi:trehalose 6-phosphate synthase